MRVIIPSGAQISTAYFMDRVTPEARSRIMSLVKQRHGRTTEKRLRALLVQHGICGWRMNGQELTGRPDFVFERSRFAVFVDGCFWHGCQRCQKKSKSNREFWNEKVRTNAERDARVTRKLRALGWSVLRIRECELKDGSDRSTLLMEIEERLRSRQN